MTSPAIPSNFYVQQADGKVLVSWNIVAGATSYQVQRSTDGVTYASIATPATNQYLDTTATLNTLYYYQVASVSSGGTSSACSPAKIVPTAAGIMSLAALRLASQQRADRENSNFVTVPEWNSYINQSAYELYDLLTTVYEDYNMAPVVQFTTDGSQFFDLPNGTNYSSAPAFYKLLGVDIGVAGGTNGWVTLKRFDYIARNRYVFPQITSTAMGIFNMQYRLMGSRIMFIPTPSAAQTVRLWYIPRMASMLADTDILDGVSGWTEYVIVDAAIKALQKEESDVTALMAQKQALIDRINASAMNRDAGAPDTISNTRTRAETWGWGGGTDGAWGGW